MLAGEDLAMVMILGPLIMDDTTSALCGIAIGMSWFAFFSVFLFVMGEDCLIRNGENAQQKPAVGPG